MHLAIIRLSHRRVMVRPRMVLLHYARPLFVLHMAGAQILVAESARREDLIVGIEEIHSEPHFLEMVYFPLPLLKRWRTKVGLADRPPSIGEPLLTH